MRVIDREEVARRLTYDVCMPAGDIVGRRSDSEITVYKSLGHVVQDLASVWALYGMPGESCSM